MALLHIGHKMAFALVETDQNTPFFRTKRTEIRAL